MAGLLLIVGTGIGAGALGYAKMAGSPEWQRLLVFALLFVAWSGTGLARARR